MPKRSLDLSDESGTVSYGHFLNKEDYNEPRCLLGDPREWTGETIQAVPQQRILQKMDEYMSRRDYAGACRHLLYWLEEARAGKDLRGELLVCNELIGHYRKTADRTNALKYVREALRLLDLLDFDGTVSAGTTYVNAATALHAFGEYDEASSLFEKARAIYEAREETGAQLLGGLYNNMALNLMAKEDYREAYSLFEKAIAMMDKVPGGALEQAITCLNMADVLEAQYGMEEKESEIFSLLDQALSLLENADAPRDGYYAFVCEKCAPVYGHYGFFLQEAELNRRAAEILENGPGSD